MITQGAASNGSAYFRALQYCELLTARRFNVREAPAPVAGRMFDGRLGAAVLVADHTYRYARRTREVEHLLAESDAVLVQRGAYPIGPAAVLRALKRFRGRVVYDLDDAIFLPTPTLAHRSAMARWAYRDRQSLALLDRADAVVVSTPELDEALPGRRADAILPTIPDVAAYPTARQGDVLPLRLGWIGSEGNLRYLDPLRQVLARLAQEGIATVEVVSSAAWEGPAGFRRWGRGTEAESVAGFEVGLMPLPDDPYTRAKAGFKLLQYMAAGCAVIASPVGVNRGLVEGSGGGLLATDPGEWEAAIRQLASDPGGRTELGLRGRRFVREFADLGRHADVLAALLRGDVPPSVPQFPS